MKSHLIVDDNEINREVLTMIINHIPEQTTVGTSDAKQAIEIITKGSKFDFIWLDLQLGGMNGIELTKILRKDLGIKNNIIGVTGHVDEDTKLECIESGMNSVLCKPVFQEDVSKTISRTK